MMTAQIQTIGRSGEYGSVNLTKLIDKTGFDGTPAADLADLFDHAVNCYPNQDWRLVGADGRGHV